MKRKLLSFNKYGTGTGQNVKKIYVLIQRLKTVIVKVKSLLFPTIVLL
jgi:hypothetical protein